MIQERASGRLIAWCDVCRFASPCMSIVTRSSLDAMLRAAGWSAQGETTLCPGCAKRKADAKPPDSTLSAR